MGKGKSQNSFIKNQKANKKKKKKAEKFKKRLEKNGEPSHELTDEDILRVSVDEFGNVVVAPREEDSEENEN